jgi:beta-galactosidase
MEKLGQAYGFVLYSTHINHIKDYKRALGIGGLKDRATIYGNGEYLGTYMRSRGGQTVYITPPEEGLDLDILVENMGRVNQGHYILDEIKGITGHVTLDDGSLLMDWTNTSLPMTPETLKRLDYSLPPKKDRPAVFRGSFAAKAGVDTFVNMKGWTKGAVYVNGFNLGRYWNVGPQETLYLPGELVREHNTIEILELHNPKPDLTVTLDDKPMLDAISPDNKKTLAD